MIVGNTDSEATCAAGFVRALLDFAVAKGADAAELLARAEIPASAFEDLDARLPFARYIALMRAAKAMTGDDALALHFGEHVPQRLGVHALPPATAADRASTGPRRAGQRGGGEHRIEDGVDLVDLDVSTTNQDGVEVIKGQATARLA